jgi:hypothetical protein
MQQKNNKENKTMAVEKKETKTTGKAGRPKKTAEPKPKINEEIEAEAVEEDQEPTEEEPIKVEESETYIVSCKDPTHVLNVRSGPGKQFAIVTTIPNGSKVSIGEKKNGFGCLGPGKWVMLDLLK